MVFQLGSVLASQLVKLTHVWRTVCDAVAVAICLAILLGMGFFQRWARLIFVIVLAVGLLTGRSGASVFTISPPSFVAPVGVFMLLLTGAIVAMSFLPPVRDCFATREA